MTMRRQGEILAGSSSRSSPLTTLVLAFIILIYHRPAMASPFTVTTHPHISSLRLARIQRHLDKINKPPVKTIRSPDGDLIDCIEMHNQPALDHPLLKHHELQTMAPERPRSKEGERRRNFSSDGISNMAWQIWHQSGHCPTGTVPIRRSSVNDVLRAKSLYHYGKKRRRFPPAMPSKPTDLVATPNDHEYAIAHMPTSEEVYGARAALNVWMPYTEAATEFSLSQIWILSGSFNGSDLNSIEAGWQVSSELYGDARPRLFTYWTSDAYEETGCYNLLCSGFIQINRKIAIGAAIDPISILSGAQYDITILIWKDPNMGNWWMSYGEHWLVGYWPAELFTHLAAHATMVHWGGEVVNTRPNGVHTRTEMGSGQLAEVGFGRSSYFRNLEIVDSDNSLSSVQSVSTTANKPACYNVVTDSNNDWGTYIYYGGPGWSERCP